MALDPEVWANTPGLGRAPLLPDPVMPTAAAASPMQDIARRLLYASGDQRVMERDRPVGALVRDPASMSMGELSGEMRTLGGGTMGAPEATMATRAPGALMGALTGNPIVSAIAGSAGQGGGTTRLGQLGGEMGRRMGQTYSGGYGPESLGGSWAPATMAGGAGRDDLSFGYQTRGPFAYRDIPGQLGGTREARTGKIFGGSWGIPGSPPVEMPIRYALAFISAAAKATKTF